MDKSTCPEGSGGGGGSSSNGVSKSSGTSTTTTLGGLEFVGGRFRKTKGLINEDFCTYCKEGGNLLNCDRCPASFHFLCMEPPLEPDEIPKGEFLCSKCDYETHLLATGQFTPAELKRYADKRAAIHHNDLLVVVHNSTDSTMDVLMRMSKAFNPGQMRLSKGIKSKYDTNMPGSNRFRLYHKAITAIDEYLRATGGLGEISSSAPNESDLARKSNGDVISYEKSRSSEKRSDVVSRKTIKLCYICKKSIKADKLLCCDFCPLAYHADCIFTLIDAVPNTKEKFWMCPCHAEHLIDQKMLTSDQVTERIKLWSNFRIGSPSDVERIKKGFFERCQRLCAGDEVRAFPTEPSDIPNEIVSIYTRSCRYPTNLIELSHSDMMAIEALEMLKNSSNNSDQQPIVDQKDEPELDTLMKSYVDRNDLSRVIPSLDGRNRRVKAFLHHLPLDVRKSSSLMTYCMNSGSITIGNHPTMDLCLRPLSGTCSAISDKHAVIYHDKFTGLFELLNYSEFGSMVDNCVYNSNMEEDVIDFWAGNSESVDSVGDSRCRCRLDFDTASPTNRFIEGPALLKHGSLIRFGCVTLLFIAAQKRSSPVKRTALSHDFSLEPKRHNTFVVSNERNDTKHFVMSLIGDSNKAALV